MDEGKEERRKDFELAWSIDENCYNMDGNFDENCDDCSIKIPNRIVVYGKPGEEEITKSVLQI